MTKIGKNLGNLVRKTGVVLGIGIPLVLTGCHKQDDPIEPPKDTTPPVIEIYSPVENQVYKSKKVLFSGLIKDPNFNKAEYSTDNGQTKKTLKESWSDSLSVENGNQKVIVYTSDIYNNSSTSTVDFSVNYTAPPVDKTPPKITISSPIKNNVYTVNNVSFTWNIDEPNFNNAWYSIDNGSKTSIAKSGTENESFENGNHKIVVGAGDLSGNTSKDSTMFTTDVHTWKYEVNPFVQPNDTTKPIVWNNFSTIDQRGSYYYDRLYNYDFTNKMTYIPGNFVCTDFASMLATNFNGYGELGFDPAKGLEHNGEQNIPMYIVYLSVTGGGPLHTIDGVVIGDNFANVNDWIFTESESDSTYSPSRLKELGAYEIQANYTRVLDTETQGKVLDNLPMFKFVLDVNNKWVDSGYRNPDINLIEKRKK
jgi:hypothetical protein